MKAGDIMRSKKSNRLVEVLRVLPLSKHAAVRPFLGPEDEWFYAVPADLEAVDDLERAVTLELAHMRTARRGTEYEKMKERRAVRALEALQELPADVAAAAIQQAKDEGLSAADALDIALSVLGPQEHDERPPHES